MFEIYIFRILWKIDDVIRASALYLFHNKINIFETPYKFWWALTLSRITFKLKFNGFIYSRCFCKISSKSTFFEIILISSNKISYPYSLDQVLWTKVYAVILWRKYLILRHVGIGWLRFSNCCCLAVAWRDRSTDEGKRIWTQNRGPKPQKDRQEGCKEEPFSQKKIKRKRNHLIE